MKSSMREGRKGSWATLWPATAYTQVWQTRSFGTGPNILRKDLRNPTSSAYHYGSRYSLSRVSEKPKGKIFRESGLAGLWESKKQGHSPDERPESRGLVTALEGTGCNQCDLGKDKRLSSTDPSLPQTPARSRWVAVGYPAHHPPLGSHTGILSPIGRSCSEPEL